MPNQNSTMPVLSPEGGLQRYLSQIHSFPMLEREEEYELAKAWKERQDGEAATKLVTSHLRLVAKTAKGYRGYGLPLADLISEGQVGLMQAVRKFEPEKGFRLATYALFWIRASIQEYIIRSWSLVKVGTTASQKKLFFNLRRLKGQIQAVDSGDLRPDQVTEIANKLDVSEADVISMNGRMGSGGDKSLNAPVMRDGEGGDEYQDWIVDESPSHTEQFAETEEHAARSKLMLEAMQSLSEREREILTARRLHEPQLTLEDLSSKFDVSRERVRQIEVRAFEKLQKKVRELAVDANLITLDQE